MENATKALMIAGAVLLVILIIGVGMAIFNAGNETIGEGTKKMSNQKIQMFNDQFSSYEGTQSGSNVKQLISTVIQANQELVNSGTNGDDRDIKVTYGKDTDKTKNSDLSKMRSSIVAGNRYTVSIEGFSDEGYINSIKIENLAKSSNPT